MVVYDRYHWDRLKMLNVSGDLTNMIAFMLSAYNGGLGSLIKDRKMCLGVAGCDSSLWFDNVEKHRFMGRVKTRAFRINRDYVRSIVYVRSEKYDQYLNEDR